MSDTRKSATTATPGAAAAPDRELRLRLKRIAHHLDPVVLIGDQGLSDAVTAEAERALRDHELIKVRIHSGDRTVRAALASELAESCGATVIQSIGKVVVLFRSNPQPNPKLSNLTRFSTL